MGIGAALAASAVVGAGASLVSGSKAAGAATQAAQVQSDASTHAADLLNQQYQTTRNDLLPFQAAGRAGVNALQGLIPGTAPAAPTTNPDGTPIQYGTPAGGGPAYRMFNGANPDIAGDPNNPGPAPVNPYLAAVQNLIPGSGSDPALVALNNLTPGSATPDATLTAAKSFIPGAVAGVTNPLTSAVYNFVPGASATPDPTLTALQGFTPGGPNQNPLVTQLNAMLGVGSVTGAPDPAAIQSALEATPGYQFTLGQGLKSVQNSYAAKGLGSSGAALKGAADYATGLSDATYESRLNDYLNSYNSEFTNTQNSYNSQFTNNLNADNTQFTNALNLYGQNYNNSLNTYNSKFTNAYNAYGQQVGAAQGLANLGENAGAQTGTIGANTTAAIGNTLTSGAAAQAAGIVGSTNATTNALTGVANTVGNTALTAALLKSQGTPAATSSTNPLTFGVQNAGASPTGIYAS